MAVLGIGMQYADKIPWEPGSENHGFDRADKLLKRHHLHAGWPRYPLQPWPGLLKELKGFDLIFKTPKVRFDYP